MTREATPSSRRTELRILAVPRDGNPFQEQLYTRMRGLGARVEYLDGPTVSQTVNLVLMPVVLLVRRIQGFTVLHLHWTFGFVPAWARTRRSARLFRRWFTAVLTLTTAVGYRVIWTAHNVLPHNPVFDDDAAARRSLVGVCDAIIAMNESVAHAIQAFSPRCAVTVIPHGTDVTRPEPAGDVAQYRAVPPGATFVFFGRIEPYKGIPDLLAGYDAAELTGDPLLLIAGACRDPHLEHEIRELAGRSSKRVRLVLRTLTDDEVMTILAAADVLVFPFRAISTSGSVLTGMQSGSPVVVPDLPAFADIPSDAVLRYRPTDGALSDALERAATLSGEERYRVVEASDRHLAENSWDRVAALHVELFERVAGGES